LAWFNFLDTIAFDTDEISIHTLEVEICLHPINETNTNIPFRRMIAPQCFWKNIGKICSILIYNERKQLP
jgi:hypothetical protein